MTKKYLSHLLLAILLSICAQKGFSQADDENRLQLESLSETEMPSVVSCDCNETEPNCTGTLQWDDGSSYEGEFEYGKIHGVGKLQLADGAIYEGTFENEIFHGYGTLTYAGGGQYMGDWVEGYREGQGTYIFPDGSEYMGEFKGDQIHGEGAILLSSGETYSGTWVDGHMHGFGNIIRQDGSTYYGMNNNGERDGPGFIVWDSGDTLFGNWTNGAMNEEAVFQFENGTSIVSQWKDGIMSDTVKYIEANGYEYAAPPTELAALVLDNVFDMSESLHENFELAFYAIGMEYKSMNDYEKAAEHFEFAMNLGEPGEESPLFEQLETQMANMESEQKSSGMARKKDEY